MPNPRMMRIFRINDGKNEIAYPVRDSYINFAYGECLTVAANTQKIVAIDTTVGWKLRSSSMVVVHFTYSVPEGSTLNVDNTGAKSIYQNGQPIGSSIITAGDTATFVYDGTRYLLVAVDRTGADINNKLDSSLKGAAGGLAELDSSGKVPASQLPADINNKLDSSLKGAAGGLAELDSSGKVPASQLPAYVDDVLEYSTWSAFPATGESGKIYVAIDTGFEYRWSGTQYFRLDKYDLATQSSSGLMSASDKAKLDTLPFSVVNGQLCITYKKEVEE